MNMEQSKGNWISWRAYFCGVVTAPRNVLHQQGICLPSRLDVCVGWHLPLWSGKHWENASCLQPLTGSMVTPGFSVCSYHCYDPSPCPYSSPFLQFISHGLVFLLLRTADTFSSDHSSGKFKT